MIGLGTYAFFWRHQRTLPDGSPGAPIDLTEMLRRSSRLGAEVFQICDYDPVLGYGTARLRGLRALADDLGLALEFGGRGVEPARLAGYLDVAGVLGAPVVRSMLFAPDSRPTLADAERMLREVLPEYEGAGVVLALETYEQVPSADLVALVETVGSPSLGICLDPANGVAALEHPRDVVERCAPYVANLHVKDFRFTRQAGWVGFELAGAPLGTGLLDYDHLVRTVDPTGRGLSRIVEHWVPWQGDLATTVALEDDWTAHAIRYLKEHP